MLEGTGIKPQRVPPVKLLGARRALASLGYGAIVGVAVAFIVAAVFSPAATTDSLRTGLIIMSLFFGVLFGPMLTLLVASRLAVAGFVREDFGAAGWLKLCLLSLGGLVLGIGIGFVVGSVWVQVLPAGDAIIFMFAVIGGTLGVLLPVSALVGKAAKRRIRSVNG